MTEFAPKITYKCPECSTEIEMIEVPEWLLTQFKGGFGRMIALLLKGRREHQMITMRQLCLAKYPGRWADVPEEAANRVWTTIRYHRPRLNSMGWEIAMPKHGRTDGFFLVAIAPKGPFDYPLQRYRKGSPSKLQYNLI